MKERPILFSGAMVQAILDGRKTQTRRKVKPQPYDHSGTVYFDMGMLRVRASDGCDAHWWSPIWCPYGVPGGRLWVKETFKTVPVGSHLVYRADEPKTTAEKTDHAFGPWKPSIFCPRKASRITLEIISVRVERLNEISADDADAEGCGCGTNDATGGPVARYKVLWESINGPGSWAKNPWVWVLEFKRV